MKKLKPLIDSLAIKILTAPAGWEEREISGAFASDLISDILVIEGENTLLVTSLLSDQVLHAADVVGASAVIFVNRNHVPASLGKAAAKQNLPLFHTPLTKFDFCVRLGNLLESI